MLNKNERMNKLNAMGINTNKYFTLDAGDGTTIHVIIDKNGNPVKVDDVIANSIIEDGYVRNTKLHRRFVMAQMFHMLNYKSYDGRREGYNEALKMRGLKYSFDMMLEEIRVLGKLETRDKETFVERSHFFTKDVIIHTMNDYMDELKKYIDTIPNKKCKGVPYKRIKGKDVFVVDIDKKVYAPLRGYIHSMKYYNNYNDMYRIVQNFMNDMIALPYDTPKSKAWIDAYKGEGAFYTLKNLVMFHDCGIKTAIGTLYGTSAVVFLTDQLDVYQGEGWRMFALMKKVIKDNNFDFATRMSEIYND